MKINDRIFSALVLTLFTFLVFFSGRFSVQYAVHEKVPPIVAVDEVNKKVPMVEIVGLQEGYLFGKVNLKDMRLRSKDEVAIPDEKLEFRLNMNEFLPREQQIKEVKAIGAPQGSKFVASKVGKYYYEIDSASGKKLSVKNRRYFATEEEAKRAGFIKKSTR